MKSAIIASAFVLSSCAWDQYTAAVPVAGITTTADPAAHIHIQCDRLGFEFGSATHRLCVLRGIDRLRVERGVGYAPIQILPQGHAYPPLAPGNSIHVYPSR